MLTTRPELGIPQHITLTDELAAAARSHPDTDVIFDSVVHDDKATLGELFEESCRVACGLVGFGIEPGDVVALQIPNRRECLVAHAAVWLAGAVLLPIVPIYGPREVSFILHRSSAKAFIVAETSGKRDIGAILTATEEVKTLSHRFVVGDAPTSAVPYSALVASRESEFRPTSIEPSHRCLLIYTSGTTAEPKGVQHSHAGMLAEIRSIDQMRTASDPLSNLSVFPSGHVAGVLNIIRILTNPATSVVMDAWDPARAARLISKHEIRASAGAPIHLGQILSAAQQDRLDLSSLAEYTTGAAGVAAALIRRADEIGIRAYRSYGSTEHPTVSIGDPDDPLDRRAETDGRLTPGTEVLIVDDEGTPVPAGGDGEILTRGPELFLGYLDSDRRGAGHDDGWFRTGDVGRLDPDGFLTITDRKKDIIVRGGENLSSREIEDVIVTHPAVTDAAAIGMPEDVYGERVCAFVVLRPGDRFTVRDAVEHFAECGLALVKTPERIIAVAELPRTAGGKVQKHLLRDWL